jgi:probable rRNA maturation factor
MSVSLDIDRKAWKGLGSAQRMVRRAVRAALNVAEVSERGAFLSVVLTDDATVRTLNRRWRKMDKPTNVLSFPQPDTHPGSRRKFLGDIVLAGELVDREARRQGKTLANHASHLIVHGVLHLLGHQHRSAREAREMERLEVKALARLDIADPYQSR